MDFLQAQIAAMKAKRSQPTQSAATGSQGNWVRKADLEKEREQAYLLEQKRAQEAREKKEEEKLKQIKQVYREEDSLDVAKNKESTEKANNDKEMATPGPQEEEKKDEKKPSR